MTFGCLIAMCRDRGVTDNDKVDSIIGYFNGEPASDFECEVWPGRDDRDNAHKGKLIDFRHKRRVEV